MTEIRRLEDNISYVLHIITTCSIRSPIPRGYFNYDLVSFN